MMICQYMDRSCERALEVDRMQVKVYPKKEIIMKGPTMRSITILREKWSTHMDLIIKKRSL